MKNHRTSIEWRDLLTVSRMTQVSHSLHLTATPLLSLSLSPLYFRCNSSSISHAAMETTSSWFRCHANPLADAALLLPHNQMPNWNGCFCAMPTWVHSRGLLSSQMISLFRFIGNVLAKQSRSCVTSTLLWLWFRWWILTSDDVASLGGYIVIWWRTRLWVRLNTDDGKDW